jgi:hypothetical protein
MLMPKCVYNLDLPTFAGALASLIGKTLVALLDEAAGEEAARRLSSHAPPPLPAGTLLP